LSVVVTIARGQFLPLGVVEKPRFCHPICYSSRAVNISGFGGRTVISVCRRLSQSLGDTAFGLEMVENSRLAVGISTLSIVPAGTTISGFGGHIATSGCCSL